MNRPIRISVQLTPQHADYDTIRQAAIRADEIGLDAIYNWDHFFPLSGDPDGLHFECWTMLGSWAEVTTDAEIGPLVTCNSYRNPDLLADMARTVDHASGGRLILGIGAGWFERDYEEYGYEFGTAADRLTDLERALPRIEARFDELNPAPTRRIPILVGGGGEKKTLRYTARHADIWHGFGGPETIARKNRILDSWCAEEGTDPQAIERSVGVKPDRIDLVDAYLDAGTTHFTMEIGGPDYDLSVVRPWLALRDERNG